MDAYDGVVQTQQSYDYYQNVKISELIHPEGNVIGVQVWLMFEVSTVHSADRVPLEILQDITKDRYGEPFGDYVNKRVNKRAAEEGHDLSSLSAQCHPQVSKRCWVDENANSNVDITWTVEIYNKNEFDTIPVQMQPYVVIKIWEMERARIWCFNLYDDMIYRMEAKKPFPDNIQLSNIWDLDSLHFNGDNSKEVQHITWRSKILITPEDLMAAYDKLTRVVGINDATDSPFTFALNKDSEHLQKTSPYSQTVSIITLVNPYTLTKSGVINWTIEINKSMDLYSLLHFFPQEALEKINNEVADFYLQRLRLND